MWMVSFFIKIYWTIKKSKMQTRIYDSLCAERRKSVHVRVRGLCFAGSGAITGKFNDASQQPLNQFHLQGTSSNPTEKQVKIGLGMGHQCLFSEPSAQCCRACIGFFRRLSTFRSVSSHHRCWPTSSCSPHTPSPLSSWQVQQLLPRPSCALWQISVQADSWIICKFSLHPCWLCPWLVCFLRLGAISTRPPAHFEQVLNPSTLKERFQLTSAGHDYKNYLLLLVGI